MTVSSTVTPRVQYSGNGSTTIFSVPFVFVNNTDLVVISTTAGVDTTLVLTTNYTVTGGGSPPATGSITMTVAPGSSTTITIYRGTSKTQSTQYIPYDTFPATSHEAALDKLTLISQEVQDGVNRAVVMAPSSGISGLTFPSPVASQLISWDPTATFLTNVSMADATLNINSLTAATPSVSADYIPFYSTSALTNKKVLFQNIPIGISNLTAKASPDASNDYGIIYSNADGSNRKVLLSNWPSAGGNAPVSATYLTLSTNATLTNERVFTAGTAISTTDNGANNTYVVSVNVNGPSEDTSPVLTDFVLTYDVSATATKKAQIGNLPININGLTEDTSPDSAADYVMSYDASAATNKKVKVTNLNTNSLVYLSTTTASGASSVDFIGLSSTYTSYLILVTDLLPSTSNVALYFRTSTDNGSTYTSSANTYSYANGLGSGSNATATEVRLLAQMSSTAGKGWGGEIIVHNPASGSLRTSVQMHAWGTYVTGGTDTSISMTCGGRREAAETNNAIRFLSSSGNINGTFAIYGIK